MIETIKETVNKQACKAACAYYTRRKHHYGNKFAYSKNEAHKDKALAKYTACKRMVESFA